MYTRLHPDIENRPGARDAVSILGNCVHCGFCNATCPTYLELGDERDGPRGRIYLIKNLLETGGASDKTRQHLDRCLTCRACETTCPSGVKYASLADFGRELLEEQLQRPFSERLQRRLLRLVVPYRRRFGVFLRAGQALRFLMPGKLRAKIPGRQRRGSVKPATKAAPKTISHARMVVLLDGCVQSAATPATNQAAVRVLDRLNISALNVSETGCCGALSYHLGEHEEARSFIRKNIDALMSAIESGAERIISSASGCTVMLKDYAKIMADDPDYAQAASRISELTLDLSEALSREDLSALAGTDQTPTALHCPCTLTHGLGLDEQLRDVLQRSGVQLTDTRDDHLCCGSAGTYSILQPEMSQTLLDNKISALTMDKPDRIVTANVGCQLHLAAKSEVAVSHWIELLAE
ncbi:glycolate oxidase subunit GlcF [Pseudomonadota bacterium]